MGSERLNLLLFAVLLSACNVAPLEQPQPITQLHLWEPPVLLRCPVELEDLIRRLPVPADTPIVRPERLSSFYHDLLDLVMGSRRKVRIAYYGDSNASEDWPSYYLRQQMGELFGHGGHGYVLAGRPLPWYRHRGVKIRIHGGWRSYLVTVPKAPGWLAAGQYGHGGGLGAGLSLGASVAVQSASPTTFVQVQYLSGGSFTVAVDGRDATAFTPTDAGSMSLVVPRARHELEITTIRPNVRILGIVMEDGAGVVVDGIGIGGVCLENIVSIPAVSFVPTFLDRRYSLVIMTTGTNLYRPHDHTAAVAKLISRLCGVDLLLTSPPPRGRRRYGEIVGVQYTADIAQLKSEIAKELRLAYWDYYGAMGGNAALKKLYRRGFYRADLIHLRRPAHQVQSTRLFRALMDGFYHYIVQRYPACRLGN